MSVLSLLRLQFTCLICRLILITSFTDSLSHSCKYFFLSNLSSTIVLAFVPRNVKGTYTDQSIRHFFVLSLKRNDSQTFKCSCINKPFLQCICYWYNLLRWIFLIICGIWKTLFFIKPYRYSESYSNRHITAFFERNVLNKVRILRYLHNNSTVLIPKFENKV